MLHRFQRPVSSVTAEMRHCHVRAFPRWQAGNRRLGDDR